MTTGANSSRLRNKKAKCIGQTHLALRGLRSLHTLEHEQRVQKQVRHSGRSRLSEHMRALSKNLLGVDCACQR